MIQVLLAVPYPTLADAMQVLLEQQADIQVVAKTSSEAETLALVAQLQPTNVVLDVGSYGFSGIEMLIMLSAAQPHIPLLVVGHSDLPYDAHRIRQAGAADYLPKYELATRLTQTVKTIATNNQQ